MTAWSIQAQYTYTTWAKIIYTTITNPELLCDFLLVRISQFHNEEGGSNLLIYGSLLPFHLKRTTHFSWEIRVLWYRLLKNRTESTPLPCVLGNEKVTEYMPWSWPFIQHPLPAGHLLKNKSQLKGTGSKEQQNSQRQRNTRSERTEGRV